jgi:cystathionine beta-lyase/cystathionine gamma-synthase
LEVKCNESYARTGEHLPPALLRLSVGIEAVEDLWTDLDRALLNVPEV